MSLPEEFETILRDLVNSKRLSASKMTSLTDIAMKNMEHDTQLVSILYRTHKSLSTTAAKISSLYVFDALSRAAKHHSTKHSLIGDTFTVPGNSASFLSKVGGVVEGLFKDMVFTGSAEAKEKTKKILDIWVKGNTFPSSILSQLSDVLKGTEKVPDPKASLTADPRLPSQLNHTTAISFSQHMSMAGSDSQAALLALLTQAAASTTVVPASLAPQIAANSSGPAAQLDAAQLAVIQQLAHTVASVPSVSHSLPLPESVKFQRFPSSGVNGSSHTSSLPAGFRDQPQSMTKNEQKRSGYHSPERENRSDHHFDDSNNLRGRPRGGYRNRGRGDRFPGRNWDIRDRDRHRDTDRDSSPPRSGRSRSRSPPSRYGGRRDSRNYSPPRRSYTAGQHSGQRQARESEPGKDEFGRDIRPESPASNSVVNDDKSPPHLLRPIAAKSSPSISPRSPAAVKSVVDLNHDQKNVSPLITANTSSNQPSASVITESGSNGLGIESLDLSTFDYTSPASWEALGKMWQVTHGYLPSAEQLMQYVVTSGTGQLNSNMNTMGQNMELNPRSTYRGRGRGRGAFSKGPDGLYGNGRVRQLVGRDYNDNSQGTDAIVLGGGMQSDDADNLMTKGWTRESQDPELSPPSTTGRMQKVGDKWLFVRGMAADTP